MFDRIKRSVLFSLMMVTVVVVVLWFPGAAMAQDLLEGGAPMDTASILALVAGGLIGLFGVAYGVVQKMAAREAVDGWDTALEWMEKAKPIIALATEWADPESKSVPPTPANPAGETE